MAKTTKVVKKISIEFDAKTVALLRGIGNVQNAVRQLAKEQARFHKKTFGQWKKLKDSIMAVESALNLITRVGKAVIGVFTELSRSALYQSETLRYVANALRLHGIAWEDAGDKVKEFAAATQHATGIADDATQELMSQLATMTVGVEQSLDDILRMTALTQDVAFGTGQSILTVGRAIARVVSGDAVAARRIMPGLTDEFRRLAQETDSAAKILELIEDHFGGLRHRVDPLVRDLGRVDAGFGDLKESLGDMINNALVSSGSIESLGDTLDDMAGWFYAHGDEVTRSLISLASAMMAFGNACTWTGGLIADILVPPLQQLDRMLQFPLFDIAGWGEVAAQMYSGVTIGDEWSADAEWEASRQQREGAPPTPETAARRAERDALLAAQRRRQWVREQLRLLSHQLPPQDWGPPERGGRGGDGRQVLDHDPKTIAMTMQAKAREAAGEILIAWQQRMMGSFDAIVSEVTGLLGPLFEPKVQGEETGKGDFAGAEMIRMKEAAEAAAQEVQDVLDDIWASMASTAGRAMSDTFSAVGAFCVGTEGAFKNLGKAIKSSFASTFGSLSRSMMSAAVTGIATGASGPFGLLLGLGAVFGLVAGALGGSGGPAVAASGPVRAPDVLSSIRGEGAVGRTVIHQHLNIGTVFADHDEAASSAVARYAERAASLGEWRL